MTFAYPLLLLFPLAVALACFARRKTFMRSHVAIPSASLLSTLPVSTRQRLRTPLLTALTVGAIACLTVASARPQRITVFDSPTEGRNIILVVDVSRSMAERDFPAGMSYISRLQGLKTVVADYLKNRSQDRVGLVVFGNAAYLQSPLTTDTALVEQFVQALRPRMAGDGTAIGDGLGLALKRLKRVSQSSRAIILMTDGVNTAGQISPLKAAQVAKELNVQIHTVGIGGLDSSNPQSIGDLFTLSSRNPAEFDEATLKKIAAQTGGVYFNANSLAGFQQVYKEIEKLTSTQSKTPASRQVEELFAPWATAGLLMYAALLLLNHTVFMRVP